MSMVAGLYLSSTHLLLRGRFILSLASRPPPHPSSEVGSQPGCQDCDREGVGRRTWEKGERSWDKEHSSVGREGKGMDLAGFRAK